MKKKAASKFVNDLPSAYGMGFTVRNVNEALPLALQMIHQQGQVVTSRGMETLELRGPTMTIYKSPNEMVLFDPVRDANPFFHLFEAMWILSGSRHCALPAHFLPRITDYSDDQKTFHGAYGFRLRNWPGGEKSPVDQLMRAVQVLRDKPDTRQAVMSIWDPARDLGAVSKDIPCNDMITFKVRDGKLNMTVFNRSNDVIWGAYGANVVQFSVLMAWVAAMVGLPLGYYTQVSDSFHVYTDLPLWKKYADDEWHPSGHVHNPYEFVTDLTPLFTDAEDAAAAALDAEMLNQMARQGVFDRAPMLPGSAFRSNLGKYTLRPMIVAHANFKAGFHVIATEACDAIQRADWRLACREWISRRMGRAKADTHAQDMNLAANGGAA